MRDQQPDCKALRATAPLKPPLGVALTVKLVEPPAVTFCEPGDWSLVAPNYDEGCRHRVALRHLDLCCPDRAHRHR